MADQERTEKAIIAAGLVDRWMAESKYDFDTVTRLMEDPETPPEHRERLLKKLRALRVVVDRLHETLYGSGVAVQAPATGVAPVQPEAKPATEPPKPAPPGGVTT